MKFSRKDPWRWRRGFAWLPVSYIGADHAIWLEHFWWRPGGEGDEISFTDPTATSSPRETKT